MKTITALLALSVAVFSPTMRGWALDNAGSAATSAGLAVSVRDYGATGNGTTDDTAAIQAAIDTSRVVYFPPGVYRFTSTLRLRDNTVLYGDAPESKITALAYWGPRGTAVSVTDLSQVTIRDLRIEGIGRASIGIDATNLVWFLHLRGLIVTGFDTALKLRRNQQVRITQCTFFANTKSIEADWVNTIQFNESSIFDIYGVGIIVGGAAGPVHVMSIRDSSIENSGHLGAVGISIVSGRAIAIDNVYFEIDSSSGPAIQVPPGASMAKSIGIYNSYVGADLASYAIFIDRHDATLTVSNSSFLGLRRPGAAIRNITVGSLTLSGNESTFQDGGVAPVVDNRANTVALTPF